MRLKKVRVLTHLENDNDMVSQSGVVDPENCANPGEGGTFPISLHIWIAMRNERLKLGHYLLLF